MNLYLGIDVQARRPSSYFACGEDGVPVCSGWLPDQNAQALVQQLIGNDHEMGRSRNRRAAPPAAARTALVLGRQDETVAGEVARRAWTWKTL